MQPPSTRRELLSVDDYAARTGISPTEIRRQIRAGTLPAETFQRPQGTYYRVIVDTPDDTPPAAEQAPTTSQDAPAPATEPPAAITRALDIMDALLRANAETMERQAERIDALHAALREETAKRTAAETDASHERTRAEDLAAHLALAERPWWRKLLRRG